MATLNPTHATEKPRPRIEGYPASSLRFDTLVAVLSIVFMSGAYLDGWAHTTYRNLIDTFFTPWRAARGGIGEQPAN